MTTLTIQGYQFEVPEGVLAMYSTGATIELDEGTASTLRQVKCENLRNNFANAVKKALNGAEELTSEALTALQGEFEKYAAEYKFGVRKAGGGGGRRIVDPVEREANKLAMEDLLKAHTARHGAEATKEAKKSGALNEARDRLLAAKHDEYHKRARSIVRERDRAAEGTLEAAGI